ncbi:MAG: hypothetical protein HY928_16315 [Elusimicrobia bacterium]|nr:hypothetical protein [Elusimicrobiota bacterium]
MRGESGSALVQVLIMSILLIILATGVMQVMFMNHTIIARVKRSDEHKFWVEACMAEKTAAWAGGSACGGSASDTCNYSGNNGPVVSIACAVGGQVTYTVNW